MQLNQDLKYQRLFWKIQQAGWVVMVCVIVSALLGLFGTGPISQATAVDPAIPFWVEYERFGRFQATFMFRIHLNPLMGGEGKAASVWFDQRYLADIRVERLVPEPNSAEVSFHGVTYFFRMREGDPGMVTVYARPHRLGWLEGRIGATNERVLSFRQFIYP